MLLFAFIPHHQDVDRPNIVLFGEANVAQEAFFTIFERKFVQTNPLILVENLVGLVCAAHILPIGLVGEPLNHFRFGGS